jgi:hypothetical protein
VRGNYRAAACIIRRLLETIGMYMPLRACFFIRRDIASADRDGFISTQRVAPVEQHLFKGTRTC